MLAAVEKRRKPGVPNIDHGTVDTPADSSR
jgi:hypothetical protein